MSSNSSTPPANAEKDGDGFERTVTMWPAFDKRNADPSKNYGIGSVKIRFLLKGASGAIQFVFSTGWNLPHIQTKSDLEPNGWDVGYHSLTPQYEGQQIQEAACDVLDGRPCYYDGSSLLADDVLEILIREGSDAVWNRLREVYDARFAGADTKAEATNA